MVRQEARIYENIRRTVRARRKETVRLLQDLVRVPSVSGEESAVQEVVEDAFSGCGLAVERCEATAEQIAPYAEHVGNETRPEGRPNIIGVRAGSGGGRSLLLNGHVDTVSNGDPGAWSHPPLSGEVVGDLLYGRGACDMKAGLATIIAALEALKVLGIGLRGDVTAAATVGEEDTGVGALATVLAGYRADAALITEPTRLRLVPAQAGSLVFRLTVTGSAVHASARHRGVSAFEKFLPIFEALRELEHERSATVRHPLYDGVEDKVAINFGVVRTGEWAITVPEKLVAEGRVGLIPGEEFGPSRSMVQDRITEATKGDPWLREHPPELEWIGGQSVPAEVPVDSPICLAVSRAHERVTGLKPEIEGVAYGADMRFFVRFAGMPCVMYGAGDIGWAHGPDEHVSIPEVLTATETIACLLVAWCGMTG
ncbi:Acetylornithine deacetylase [uncultured Rubrobacteraceae bacterium]|uniref:Probable succinyl-diaminopimelate desuccinylase n=1 Tax=uncultured Rubrobacteraceae bacterium TaxID=349277 RepID=A0A6J4PD73_9ACTN|nr:Acetylornithine deacetylase [uncultured Rubrobacteraceae bacterium]